jgi:hypothetical protein
VCIRYFFDEISRSSLGEECRNDVEIVSGFRRCWCSSPTTLQRVDVRLGAKRIKNPVLFVTRHTLRNM